MRELPFYRIVKGFRLPKGGMWKVFQEPLSGVPKIPYISRFSMLDIVSVVGLAILSILSPHIWRIGTILMVGITSQLIGLGVTPDDHTGDTLRAGGQKLNDWQTSTSSRTFFAGAATYTGTIEQRITLCIAAAAAFQAINPGPVQVLVPQTMLPYNASLVTFNPAVKMLCEGGNPVWWDCRAYGAAFDGTTDDTTAINQAILAATASGTKSPVVYHPGGVARINVVSTWALAIAGGPVHLFGAPGATVQFPPTLAVGEMLRVNTSPGTQLGGAGARITIEGITFDANGLKTGSGVRCFNTKDVLITRNRFTGFGWDGVSAFSYAVRLEGNVASPAIPFVWTATAPANFGQANKVVYNVFDTFIGGIVGHAPVGVIVYECDGATVSHNTMCANVGVGVSVFGPNRRIIVTENDIYDLSDVGIYCVVDATGDNQRQREITIGHNTIRNCAGDSGIKADNSRCLIIGNTCTQNQNSGIKADFSSELVIVGNLCSNNTNRSIFLGQVATAGAGSHDGAVIANNLCIDDAADGIAVLGGGDTGTTPAKNIQITGNRCFRNTGNGILLQDADSRSVVAHNVCGENGPAGTTSKAGIYLSASLLSWGGAHVSYNRCVGLVTGVVGTAKQPFGIVFDAATGKTLSKCYAYYNDCSDTPDTSTWFGTAIRTTPQSGGTVSGQYLVGTLYRNCTNGVNAASISASTITTSDIIVQEDEDGAQGQTGGGTSRRFGGSPALFQDQVKSTSSTSDASLTSYSLPAGQLGKNGQKLRLIYRGLVQTQNAVPNIKFGATVIATAVVTAGNVFEIEATVTRTGAATQVAIGTVINGTVVATITRTLPGETLSNAIIVDFRGSVVSGGTLNLDEAQVEYLAAS